MPQVIFALLRSFSSSLRPGLWKYVVLPPLIAALVWLLMLLLWLGALTDWIVSETPLAVLQGWLADWHLAWFATGLAFLGAWVVLLAGAYLIAVVITGVWALPAMVRVVAASEYPDVAARGRDSLLLSIGVTLKAVIFYLVGWLLTLPVWIVPGMAIVHSFFWLAYLNRATFAYDALAVHASREEWQRLLEMHGGRLWLLGLLAAVLAHFPLLGFFAPSLAAMSFVHYGLQTLQGERGREGAGPGPSPGNARGPAIDGEFERLDHD